MTSPTILREFMVEWKQELKEATRSNPGIIVQLDVAGTGEALSVYVSDLTPHKEAEISPAADLVFETTALADKYGIPLQIAFAHDPATNKASKTLGLSMPDAQRLGFKFKHPPSNGTFGRERMIDQSELPHPVMHRSPVVSLYNRRVICFFEVFDSLPGREDSSLDLSVSPRNGRIFVNDETEFQAGEAPPAMKAVQEIISLADRFGVAMVTQISEDPEEDDDQAPEKGMNATHYGQLGFEAMGRGLNGIFVMRRPPADQPLRYMTSITMTGGVTKSRSGYHPGFITAQVEGEPTGRFFGEKVSMTEACARLATEGVNCDIMSEDDALRDGAHAAIAKRISQSLKAAAPRSAPAP